MGAGIVVHWVKSLPVMLASLRALVQVLAAPLGMQLPANGLGKTAQEGQGPGLHVGVLNKNTGFYLQPVPALAVAVIWGLNQQMKDLCFVCFPLCPTLSNK